MDFREAKQAASSIFPKDLAEEGKLRRGGFGNVYWGGSLSDQDSPVAIKMLSMESSAQGRKEFEAEVKIISRLRHRNLVELIGWCCDGQRSLVEFICWWRDDMYTRLFLVYELLPQGSLDQHLHGGNSWLYTWYGMKSLDPPTRHF